MDRDGQEIVTRFKDLDSTLARRLVYHQILDQLQPHEWRDVRRRINEKSFQRDLLGTLPLEIAIQVIRYLDLEQVHMLRRVSKRWYDVLSSDVACSVVLRQYTGHSVNFARGEYQHKLTRYAKPRVRLQRGQPVCRLQTNLPFVTSSELATLDYVSGRYAWITENKAAIVVYSLHSQKTERFCTQNREPFLAIRLSESVVAAITTRGYCRVWDFQTKEMYSVRLPAISIRFFAVHKTKLVLSYSGKLVTNDGFIMYYDLVTRATHTISVDPELAFVGLPSTGTSLTTVHLKHGTGDNGHSGLSGLRVVKYTPDNGKGSTYRKIEYTLDLPVLQDPLSWDRFRVEYDTMDDHRDRLGILSARYRRAGLDVRCIVAATYDPLTDEICLHTLHPEKSLIMPLGLASIDRNLLYYMKNDNGKPRIWISDPSSETPRRASRNMDLELPREATNGVYTYSHHFSLRGDREFVFMIDENGVKVWCFIDAGNGNISDDGVA